MEWPGTWIDIPDQASASEIGTQLHLIESAFSEASMALILFEQSAMCTAASERAELEGDFDRSAELSREVDASRGLSFDPAEWEERRNEVERTLLHENWSRGRVPRQLMHYGPFIHAKAFLYAADQIGKVLSRLAERGDAPDHASRVRDTYYAAFPTLKEVRNSVQHMEDRGRGLGKSGKPLALKPIENALINAPEGALALNNLNGNRFGTTMADGHYGEVEVSSTALGTIRDHVEQLLNAYQWRGPRRMYPI